MVDDNADRSTGTGFTHTLGRRGVLALMGSSLAASAFVGSASAAPEEPTVSLEEPLATTSPGSPVAPTDGFADTDWTAENDLTVVKVTNLDAEGEGSLKDAMTRDVEGDGRVVVFEVGGVIDLSEDGEGGLDPETDNMFVAGQTAPWPGITLVRGTFELDGDNIVVQHVRSRAGTDTIPEAEGEGEAADSMSVQDESNNIIVDHCTASWGTDENLSAGDSAADLTFSNNLVAHGLAAPGLHPDGDEHSNGTLIGHDTEGMAVLGNLYAHNNDRHPRLKGGTRSVVANNVVYNFDTAIRLGDDVELNADEEFPTQASIVRNVYRPGENTPLDSPIVAVHDEEDVMPVKVYLEDNVTQGDLEMLADDPDPRLTIADEPPVWPEGFEPAGGTFGRIPQTAGAHPTQRVDFDEQVVRETRAREGQVIDRQDEVGGYPDYEPVTRELDVPSENFGDWLHAYTLAVESEPEPEPERRYYQVDFVEGEPLEELTDDASGDYSLQNRAIRFLHGNTEEPVTRTGAPTHTLDDSISACLADDLEHIWVADGQAMVEFTVHEGCELTLSLASYEKVGSGWSRDRQPTQEFVDADTDTFGPGTHTLTADLPGDPSDGAGGDEADAGEGDDGAQSEEAVATGDD